MTIQLDLNCDDLDSNYIRLPEYAIRIAMIFASLDNNGLIELRHWARAQMFIEHCREGLHNFYNQVNAQTDSQDKQREDRMLLAIEKLGKASVRDICRATHEATGKVRSHVQELEKAGMLQHEKLISPKNGKEMILYSIIQQ